MTFLQTEPRPHQENSILSGLGPRAAWLDFGPLLVLVTPAGLAPADV